VPAIRVEGFYARKKTDFLISFGEAEKLHKCNEPNSHFASEHFYPEFAVRKAFATNSTQTFTLTHKFTPSNFQLP
jgi:hypothetical protein